MKQLRTPARAIFLIVVLLSTFVVPATPQTSALTLVSSLLTTQGNAAHLAWSDDGTSVFLADEEGDTPAVKISAVNTAAPAIAATNATENFMWATDQHNGVLAFQPSLGNKTVGLDPVTFATLWTTTTGVAHAVATDGTRVYVPVEANPGVLEVLSSTGALVASVAAPDSWANVYGIAYDAGTQRLYVGGAFTPKAGARGGIYIFDVSQSTPKYLGHILQPSSNLAVNGTRLWTTSGQTVQTWNVSNPAAPVMIGSWTYAEYMGPDVMELPQLGDLAVNATGTRLYVAYESLSAKSRMLDGSGNAGFLIFNVTGSTPVEIASQGLTVASIQGVTGTFWEQPTAVALSPDGTTLAVSYWGYGVALYQVVNDATTLLGSVATAGEGHDVYVDAGGYTYVFNNTDLEAFSPTGTMLSSVPFNGQVDGGWATFRDQRIVLPGTYPTVAGFQNGAIVYWQPLTGVRPVTFSAVFDGTTYLYIGHGDGTIEIYQVTLTGQTYATTLVGSIRVPRANGGFGNNLITAMALQGTTLWALGSSMGVVAVNVSNPAAPMRVYTDPFTFTTNGGHMGLVVAQGRVYAGAGNAGVRIYNPATFQRTGSLAGYDVNFLDSLPGMLVLANYMSPAHIADGVYVYNLVLNPDAPTLLGWFPQPNGNANFRARALGGLIYRVPLYGVDVLSVQ